jgi:hypothetical protein
VSVRRGRPGHERTDVVDHDRAPCWPTRSHRRTGADASSEQAVRVRDDSLAGSGPSSESGQRGVTCSRNRKEKRRMPRIRCSDPGPRWQMSLCFKANVCRLVVSGEAQTLYSRRADDIRPLQWNRAALATRSKQPRHAPFRGVYGREPPFLADNRYEKRR